MGSDGLAAHTDHHALAFTADGSRLYDGNDGGVFSTTTFTSAQAIWKNLNATLAITEFSSNVSIHPTDPKQAYGGTQGNGSQRTSTVWVERSTGLPGRPLAQVVFDPVQPFT